jgi:hypothetical protein
VRGGKERRVRIRQLPVINYGKIQHPDPDPDFYQCCGAGGAVELEPELEPELKFFGRAPAPGM